MSKKKGNREKEQTSQTDREKLNSTINTLVGLASVIAIIAILVSGSRTMGNIGNQCDIEEICDSPACVYFFWGDKCSHCATVKPHLAYLENKYPDISVHSYETWKNRTNSELYGKFMEGYNLPFKEKYVPSVFIGDKYLIGADTIYYHLENEVQYCLNETCQCPYMIAVGNVVMPSSTSVEVQPVNLTLPVVVSAALIDGVNPCTFAVLIFLLAYLLSINRRNWMLLVGLTFAASVFATYTIVGLSIIHVFVMSGVIGIFRNIVIVVAVAAGLVNIKDYFLHDMKATLAIPEFARPLITKYVYKASVPAAITLGVLATLVELPCTGGIYIPIITVIAQTWSPTSIAYLILYNIIYIIPILVITGVVYMGITPESAEEWRTGRRRYMHLIGGLAMLLIGAAMLAGLI